MSELPFRPVDVRKRKDAERIVLDATHGVFGDSVRRITAKGSAYYGDFIPFWSDLDIHVTLSCVLGAEQVVEFQRRIGAHDPEEYTMQQFQMFFFQEGSYPDGWAKPVEGTYHVLFGDLAPHVRTAEQYRQEGISALARVPAQLDSVLASAVDKADGKLSGSVRLMGCFLKSALYNAGGIVTGDSEEIWRRPLAELFPLFPGSATFYELIGDWRITRQNPERLRCMLLASAKILQGLGSTPTKD